MHPEKMFHVSCDIRQLLSAEKRNRPERFLFDAGKEKNEENFYPSERSIENA
jgi:hypothetical protein